MTGDEHDWVDYHYARARDSRVLREDRRLFRCDNEGCKARARTTGGEPEITGEDAGCPLNGEGAA